MVSLLYSLCSSSCGAVCLACSENESLTDITSVKIETIVVTPFQQNARLVYDEVSLIGSVIDPGGDVQRIYARIQQLELQIESIVLTHSHIDHAGGVQRLRRLLSELGGATNLTIPLYAHIAEESFRDSIREQARHYGLPPSDFEDCPEPEMNLEDGEFIEIAGEAVELLYTPGHSPGHVSLYFASSSLGPLLIAGDTIFRESIGRTDLPFGDSQQLVRSIQDKILTLPGETKILSGHGPDSTVAHEREFNPYVSQK